MVKGLNEDILAEKGLNMKKKIKNMIYNRYYLTYTILFLIIGVEDRLYFFLHSMEIQMDLYNIIMH